MELYKIGQVCDINPRTNIDIAPESQISFIPMTAVSVDGKIDVSKTVAPNAIKNYTVFQDGDILFAKITPCMENGKGAIASKLENGYGAGSTEFIVLRPNQRLVTSEWIQLFLSQKIFRLYCQQHMTGSAGQKRVPSKFLANCDIPIPPLSEQQHIVARIEELFSQLDASVNELKTAKERLKVYRQAVLKEAFCVCSERITLSSVCKHITDGDHMPPPKAQSGIPFIMISNVNQNKINWTNTAFVGRDYYDNIDEKRRPQNGDVLYTVTGSFGIPILVDFDKEFCFQRHIALLRPDDSIVQKFLYYAMQEPSVYSQASKMATGTAQKTVGLTVLRKMTIPYAKSIRVQQEIVSKIDSQLSVCDSIEKTVDIALQQAEALRQSILKKAFEGRL